MKKIHIILLTAAALLSLGASAQSFRSGYFLDNYTYGYRINPAQVNQKGFLGIAVGNIDLQNAANFGMGNFLFSKDNSIVTGFNSKVSAEEFLSKLHNSNFIALDESLNILSFGIANGEHMHTIELNARIMNTTSMPLSLFSFLKKGGSEAYSMDGIYENLNVIGDLSYGYSMYVTDNLSVGGRLHVLVGMMNANLGTSGKIQLSDDSIYAQVSGLVNASGLLDISIPEGGSIDQLQVGIGKQVGGFGASIDLGVEYKTDFGLDAMFSITDLGMISWANNLTLDAAANVDFKGGTLTFDNGQVGGDFQDLIDVSKLLTINAGKGNSSMSMMPFNIQAGARYFMPFYDKLSVGALATYHNAKNASWFDARLGATISPARLISFSSNIGIGSFGPVWGAALDLHLGPINLTAGLDSFIGNMGKINNIPIPLNGFMENAHVGLCFAF